MKNKIVLFIVFFLFNCNYAFNEVELRAYFSPEEGCLNAIIYEIKLARKSIYVLAYLISSKKIVEALIKAHKKGIRIEVIFDSQCATEMKEVSKHKVLKEAGIKVLFNKKHKRLHDKVILIDSNIVITGSYNFTVGAERYNSENLVVIKSEYIYRRFFSHYIKRRNESTENQ